MSAMFVWVGNIVCACHILRRLSVFEICHLAEDNGVGKEAGDDVIVIGRVVSAELRLYWPSCVCIVTHMIRTAFVL